MQELFFLTFKTKLWTVKADGCWGNKFLFLELQRLRLCVWVNRCLASENDRWYAYWLAVTESTSAAVPENHVLSEEDKKHTGESLLHLVLMISANMVTLFRIRIEYRLFLCLLTVISPRRLVCAHDVQYLVSGVGNVLLLKSYCSTVHFRRITSIYQPTNAHISSHKTHLKHFKTL